MAIFTSVPPKRLAESITSSDTKAVIRDNLDWNGEAMSASDFDPPQFGVFRNETNTRLEFFEFDPSNIDQNEITLNKRGLNFKGDVSTEVTKYKKDWKKGQTIVELGANPSQMYQWLKNYIDNTAVAGSPDANNTTKGIVELAEDSEIESQTFNADTSAVLVPRADSKFLKKAVKPRVKTISSDATPTLDSDKYDVLEITDLDTDITDMSANLSGSPNKWQRLIFDITGTAERSIAWGTSFIDGGIFNLPDKTDGTTPLKVITKWNGSKWVCVGIA